MAVRPHPTKHKRYPGQTWWVIEIGTGKDRVWLPYEGTYSAARETDKRLIAQRSGGRVQQIHSGKIKDLVVPFLAWYKNEVAPRTYEDMETTLDKYVIPSFGNVRPADLSVELFNDFKSELILSGLAHVTINKHLNYFSSLLRIPKYSKKKTTAEPQRALTKKDIDAMYRAIEPQYKLLFVLMADHGLRRDEAMHLRVKDVDMSSETITVRGKGNKIRMVPVMSERFFAEFAKRGKGQYVATNPATGKAYFSIRKALTRAAKAAGCGHVGHHTLRHTFATLAAQSGISPYALQRIMGHSSVETTMKIYTHIGQDFVGTEGRKLREKRKPGLRLVKS